MRASSTTRVVPRGARVAQPPALHREWDTKFFILYDSLTQWPSLPRVADNLYLVYYLYAPIPLCTKYGTV